MVFLVGLSLSMDTFSLSLSIGTFNISKKKIIIYSLIVGIMHFFLPLLGYILSLSIRKIVDIHFDKLLFFIFGFIGFEMLRDLFSKEEKEFSFTIIGMLLCALSVSIDSFTIGLCFNYAFDFVLISCLIFFLLSSFFTYLGFIIGSFCKQKVGFFANIMGIFIIFILMILQLFK